MLVNSHHNQKPNCEFAEETVSYLYGELSESQANKFQNHLENCSACADELNAFAAMNASIQTWKIEEFERLSPPVIKIPYESTEKTGLLSSWLNAFQNGFSLSRNFVQAGAFALLVIGLSLGIFFLFSNADDQFIADSNKMIEGNKISNSNIVGEKEQLIDPVPEQEMAEIQEEKSPLNQADESQPVTVPGLKKSQPQRVTSVKNSRNTERVQNKSDKTKSSESKKPKSNNTKSIPTYGSVPKLNNLPDEIEDEDLRLVDLFDEIDAE